MNLAFHFCLLYLNSKFITLLFIISILLTSLHFCTSESWGGLELYASTLMVELQRAGCHVIAVCKPNSKIDAFLKAQGVAREYLPTYRKFSFAGIRKVKNLLQQYNVDVVHVHFHTDIWISSIAVRNDLHKKLFLSVYMGVDSKNDVFHRWIYSRLNGLFSSSEEMNSRLHTLYPVPKEKIHFLPYGRRLEHYHVDDAQRRALRKQLRVRENQVLVGTMVRIDPGKCVMDFARSFLYLEKKLQPNVRYVIIGEPTRKGHLKPNESPYEPHCEAYLQQLEAFIVEAGLADKIILLGYQDRMIDYLGAMDVFVFPSRDELYSLVVLDAMCMRLPVIAARAGGNLRQVTDGVTGLHFAVADSKELAEKISLYLHTPELKIRHGNAGRKFVEKHHDMVNTIGELLQFYNKTENESG